MDIKTTLYYLTLGDGAFAIEEDFVFAMEDLGDKFWE